MIVAQYSKEEADLEPQALALGQEPQRVLAALGVHTLVSQVPDLLLITERAAHTGSWSLSLADALECGIDAWYRWRDELLSAGLDKVRRTGSPRENLKRFSQAVAVQANTQADSVRASLLAICLIRREEIDKWLTAFQDNP